METTKTPAAQAPVPAPDVKKPEFKIPKPRKKRKWLVALIVLAVIAALVGWFVVRPMLQAGEMANSLMYTPAVADYRDITVAVSGSAAIQPVDSYKVTALAKGEILNAPFEEGDKVSEGDLLYQIDAKDVENSIERSRLTVEQSRISLQNLLDNRDDARDNTEVKATDAGVIQKLYYEQGDTVAAGSPIADILDRDAMKLTVPFHAADAAGFHVGQAAVVYVDGSAETLSGTVDKIAAVDQVGAGGTLVREVTIAVRNPGALSSANTGTAAVGDSDCAASGPFANAAQSTVTARTSGKLESLKVSEGDRVSKDQLLGVFEAADMDSQIENARLSLRSAELALQSTQDQLDNYSITSPISGTVIEKNFKAGDNLDATTGGYLAVIYDMSKLTFDMKIDELDIGKIRLGQEVRITSKALEGQEFTGRVSKININGTTAGGVTSYPVTVDVDDPGDLLPGMNVSAEIQVEHAEHVLTVPVEMVGRGNVVQVLPAEAYDKDGKPDYSRLEAREVTLGRNDENYIEILSGLEEGETVVYKMSYTSLMEQMIGSMGGAAVAVGR